MAASASCVTAMVRIARSRPESGLRRAKVRDRGDVGAKIRFTSSILPKWARDGRRASTRCCRFSTCAAVTGDFQEALAALLGKDAPNRSRAVISRLTAAWQV
jgi:putative transposase